MREIREEVLRIAPPFEVQLPKHFATEFDVAFAHEASEHAKCNRKNNDQSEQTVNVYYNFFSLYQIPAY